MHARWMALGLGMATLLAAPAAWADRVALLPSRGGGTDPAARPALDGDLAGALAKLGHTIVPAPELAAAAVTTVTDGVADTLEEYRAIGVATRADWVLVGSIEPAVTTARVELSACLVRMGRVESVAREVARAAEAPQVQEMLAVLLRPEGIGAGELPWERQRPPAPPPPQLPPMPPQQQVIVTPPIAPPAPPIEGRVQLDYPLGQRDVWPAYSGGKRGFFGVNLGFAAAAARPAPAAGNGASMVGAIRGGYAAGDAGIEPFAELGGNLVGPRALWIAAGARWMLSPTTKRGSDGLLRGVPFFLGPELVVGAFIRLGGESTGPDGTVYSSSSSANAVLGAAFDLAYALSPSVQLEAQLGNLRWVPTGDGAIVLLGATLGMSVRF